MTMTRKLFGAVGVAMFGVIAVAATPVASRSRSDVQASPQSVADELLAADRAFSAASEKTDLISGISAMFSDKVIVPLPNGLFSYSAADAIKALQAAPDNAKSRATWAPIRAGVSADGQHGFTFGFMTVTTPDGSTAPFRYMSYWIREPRGWRVASFKRRRVEQAGKVTMMAPALPARIVSPVRDQNTLRAHYQSLVATENQFSAESQKIGLGIAFQKFGRSDAVNMGPPNIAGFVVGADSIGKTVGGGSPLNEPSPVVWGADTALVASSGDLGITFGVIRQNKPPTPNAAGFSFYTIWYRASPSEPWRYIAE
jgi:ketosteroid isomerase-like protein